MLCTYKITKDLNTNNKFTVWWTKIHHTWARNERQGSSNKWLERGLPRSKCPLQTRLPRTDPSPEKELGGKTTHRITASPPRWLGKKMEGTFLWPARMKAQRYDKTQVAKNADTHPVPGHRKSPNERLTPIQISRNLSHSIKSTVTLYNKILNFCEWWSG